MAKVYIVTFSTGHYEEETTIHLCVTDPEIAKRCLNAKEDNLVWQYDGDDDSWFARVDKDSYFKITPYVLDECK